MSHDEAAVIDWEDALNNGAYIPEADSYPPRWTEAARMFRENGAWEQKRYGGHAREAVDFFKPRGVSRGLLVFVHGGYWKAFDPSFWSHLAEGALAHGWTVAMPGYGLAPDFEIPDISAQIAQAVAFSAANVSGPIRLAGHSAGGHLVTRMICRGVLSNDLIERVERVVSISGLHDLRPIPQHSMNATLGLTSRTVLTESPALLEPHPEACVTAWVGGRERPEFLRQAALLVEAWRGAARSVDLFVDPGCHHFDVIEGLADRDSPLCYRLAE